MSKVNVLWKLYLKNTILLKGTFSWNGPLPESLTICPKKKKKKKKMKKKKEKKKKKRKKRSKYRDTEFPLLSLYIIHGISIYP